MTGAVCNNAQVVGGYLLGQPTEGAIVVAAHKVRMIFTYLFTLTWKYLKIC